ncbi:PAS domain-containing sensor histidine kinase [Candidatus Poribacteria bacterium]|nr:PAS domain-containing sensor histidine kinase [Candidatus Poribacteria bacterium]
MKNKSWNIKNLLPKHFKSQLIFIIVFYLSIIIICYSLYSIYSYTNGFITALLTIAGSIGLLLFSLKNPIDAINRATNFSKQMINQEGEQLNIITNIIEIDQLINALNFASEKLYNSKKYIAETNERLNAILMNAADGIITFNVIGCIDSFNPAIGKLFNYSNKEITDLNIRDLIPDFDSLKKEKNNNEFNTIQETIGKQKDGSVFQLELSISTMQFDDQLMYIAILKDITGRKLSEEALKISKEKLEKQNEELKILDKMKDGFVHDVTHELKTPVAKIRMQIQLLKQIHNKNNLTETCYNAIQIMENSIKRQENTISNILDLYRLESGVRKYKCEPIRMDLFLEEILVDYRQMLEAHNVIIEKKFDNITINSDKEMLTHVFSNLINNAIKFRNQIFSPKICIYLEKTVNECIVKIVDNGIGISQNELKKVFERFYQHSASAEGSGVGLAITKMIIEGLSGDVWVESEGENKGTTAFIKLPIRPLKEMSYHI